MSEALRAGAPLRSLFVDPARAPEIGRLAERAESRSIQVTEVSPAVMKAISATTTAPGVVAVCSFVDVEAAELVNTDMSLIMILGQVRDPGNAGTIIRTCRAAGADAIFVAAETVDIYNPKLVRATAGALFSIPVARGVQLSWLLDELGSRLVNRVAADPRGEKVYDRINMTGPTAFLVGNEARGLPAAATGPVDVLASIPMARSFESLNVAVASGVLLFEAARQRRVDAFS